VFLREMKDLRDCELVHKNAEVPEKPIDTKDWQKSIDGLHDLFAGTLGVTKLPLACVVRPEEAPAAGPFIADVEEMVMRGRMGTADNRPRSHVEDNRKAWEILSGIARGLPCWTYVKVGQSNKDGRTAWLNLHNHCLGPNAVDHAVAAAERKLQSLSHEGETRRHNWEMVERDAAGCCTVMDHCNETGEHNAPDQRARVRTLMEIWLKGSQFDSVKLKILESPELMNDCEACVALIRNFVNAEASFGRPLNVSAVSQESDVEKSNKRGRDKGKSKGSGNSILPDAVEDRFCEPAECSRFTEASKKKLRDMRAARGHTPNAKRRKLNNNTHRAQIASIVAAVAQLNVERTNDGAGTDPAAHDAATAVVDNRTNPALARQRS